MGHVRLSVIDLETGDQPLLSANGAYQLAANGEIYNYKELRKDLADSFEFQTASDSEVITAIYDRYGTDGFRQMNGMYAFMLSDTRRGRFICAVDPIGIKPLYYLAQDDVLLIGSELKAIVAGMQAQGLPIELSIDDANYYLRNGWVENRRSIVSGVRRLGPGDVLEIDDELNVRSSNISPRFEIMSDETPVGTARLKEALKDAVARQLVSDVPIGFFLSGGIDSSLLVALAREIREDVATFTVDFHGGDEAAGVSEARYAREVAESLGCRHFEFRFDAAMLQDRLDEAFACLDEPLADPAVMPLMVISEFARKHVKVCISGDGGDELFSGYARHQIQRYRRRIASNGLAASTARALGSAAVRYSGTDERSRWLRRLGLGLDMVGEQQYVYGPFAGWNRSWLQAVSVPHVADPVGLGTDLFAAELQGPLPGQMLSKMDRASMSMGLEVRVPFLDLEFIPVALSLPESAKRRGGVGKRPLRQILSEILPKNIVDRKKHGFRVPVSSWLRSELRSEVIARLVDGNTIPEDVIAEASVRTLCEEHLSGAAEHGIRIWALMSLRESIARLKIQ